MESHSPQFCLCSSGWSTWWIQSVFHLPRKKKKKEKSEPTPWLFRSHLRSWVGSLTFGHGGSQTRATRAASAEEPVPRWPHLALARGVSDGFLSGPAPTLGLESKGPATVINP